MSKYERMPVKPLELWGLYDVNTGKWVEAPILQSDAIMAFRSYEEALVGLEGEVFYELNGAGMPTPEAELAAHAIATTVPEGRGERIPVGTIATRTEPLRIARLI
jgi:hypothetical protein